MQLTRAADYGVRAMIHLAGLPEGTRVSIAELAKSAEVPEAFLTKVLQRLTAAQLVFSYRGATGGFALSTRASEISMLDVVEAIEGPIQLNLCISPCGSNSPTCGRRDWCAAHLVWAEAQANMRAILSRASIERLARESSQRIAVRRSAS